jgi:hypothetical protein
LPVYFNPLDIASRPGQIFRFLAGIMALAKPAHTDEIVPKVDIDDDYPQRADRLYDAPCAQNAQGLFSPEACLFIGK